MNNGVVVCVHLFNSTIEGSRDTGFLVLSALSRSIYAFYFRWKMTGCTL